MSSTLWDCITTCPQCCAACEPHSNVQAGHIPLVKALTCTSKITQPKVTAPFLPISPLSAAQPTLQPAKGVKAKTASATLQRQALYLFLTAGNREVKQYGWHCGSS